MYGSIYVLYPAGSYQYNISLYNSINVKHVHKVICSMIVLFSYSSCMGRRVI